MCAVSPGGKAQNLRPTALTPAREAGTRNCLEHKQGHWPDEHVMNRESDEGRGAGAAGATVAGPHLINCGPHPGRPAYAQPLSP